MIMKGIDFRKATCAGSAALVLLAGSACQELQVTNLVEADRERATGNPTDVQAFIGGAFYPTFFNANHTNSQVLYLFPIAGAEFVSTMAGANTLLFWEDVVEPRRPHDNGAILSVGNGPAGPRNFWADAHRSNTVAYD